MNWLDQGMSCTEKISSGLLRRAKAHLRSSVHGYAFHGDIDPILLVSRESSCQKSWMLVSDRPGQVVEETHESKREVTSSARSQPICPSLLEPQAFLISSLVLMGCSSPGVAKDGRCDCAAIGSSTEVDTAPTPSAASDEVIVWPDLMSLNKSPRASFPFVTVVVTIVFSKPTFDARAGAEVERVSVPKELSCCAREATVDVIYEVEVPPWPVRDTSRPEFLSRSPRGVSCCFFHERSSGTMHSRDSR